VRGLLGSKPSGEGADGEGGGDGEDGEVDQGGVVLRREQIGVVVGGGRTAGSSTKTNGASASKPGEAGEARDNDDAAVGPSSQPSVATTPGFGTLSLLTYPPYFLPSYRPLPPWLQEGTDPSLRSEASPLASQQAVVSTSVNPSFGGSASGGFGSEDLKKAAAAGMRGGGGGSSSGMGVGTGGGAMRGVGGVSNGKKKEVDLEKFYASSERFVCFCFFFPLLFALKYSLVA
jgi:hypothetical protein